jgi:hypothetical protein
MPVSAVGKRNFPGKRSIRTESLPTPVSAVGKRNFPGQRQRPRNGPCNSMGRLQRQNACRIAASSGLFALNREISICAGLRGGPERTRTACQPRSRYRTYIRPRSKPASCLQSLNPNISAATAALPPAIRNKSESAARGLNGNTTAPLVWIVHKFVESDV